MSEKDTLVRQRLIELEKKHAKALRKLQRAEKCKQRRQTFHGFTVKDENTVNNNSSSMLLSQESMSADVGKSRCWSAYKRGVCKTVTFKETVDTDGSALSENRCKSIEESGSRKASKRRSALLGSCTPMNESECSKKECDVQIDNNSFVAADNNMVIIPTGSLILSDNEKLLDENVAFVEGKDCFQIQQGKDHAGNNDLCDSEQHLSNMPSCNKVCFNSNLTQEGCFTNCQKEYNAKKVVHPSKETICDNRNSSEHNSQDIITKNSLHLPKDKVTLKKEGCLHDEKEEMSNPSSMPENDHFSSENHHWLWLFEEEFPRRSPRIQSTPDFRSQALVCQHNSVKQPIRKAKPIRTKQSRAKKYTPSNGDRTVKSNNEDNLPHGSLLKENTSDDFVFPRPTLEQTKKCGPLAVVVDFSLPDKEFAKLKLAKIKGNLSAERGSKELNNVEEKSIVRHVSEVEGDSKLTDAKWTSKFVSVDAEKTAQEHVSQTEEDSKWTNKEVNDQTGKPSELNTSETEGNSKLPDSKCGQETREDCSFSFAPARIVRSEFKTREVGNFSSPNTLEGNFSENVKEHSSTELVTSECNKQSESAVWINSSFKLEHKEVDFQLQSTVAKSLEGCIFPEQQSQKYTVIETSDGLGQFESRHCNCSSSKTVNGSCTSSIHNVQQTDGIEMINKCGPDYCERKPTCSDSNRPDHQSGFVKSSGLSDKNALSKNSTAEIKKETEFPNQRDSNDLNSKAGAVLTNGGLLASCESTAKGISKIPEQQNVQEELFIVTQEKSSPPICNHEPSLGDQATPYGKMKEPLESSQLSHVMSPEERDLLPVLMTACLQHHIEGENNRVQSVSLSSYEPSTEKDVPLSQDKRDILAVCLPHLVVIWTVMPGLQWTVLHKWTLSLDGEERFVSCQFVPLKSHIVLLVGGNFHHGNGRILGYSEEGDYSLDLENDDEKNNHFFSTMCLLHDSKEHTVDENVEFVIGDKTSREVTLTKWTLDSFCLLVEQWQTFTVCSATEMSSLQPVHGSHCLLLGTTDNNLFLWNHITCQQLRCINLHTSGLGHLFCLKAFTERGLLFLMTSSNSSAKGYNCGCTSADVCSFALNPKTSKMVCLERFCLPERVNIVCTNGQYIAAGGQGEVNMWNLTNSHRHATLQVFQDEVSSIGFHQDRPLMAFGSATGCVHLFSLC